MQHTHIHAPNFTSFHQSLARSNPIDYYILYLTSMSSLRAPDKQDTVFASSLFAQLHMRWYLSNSSYVYERSMISPTLASPLPTTIIIPIWYGTWYSRRVVKYVYSIMLSNNQTLGGGAGRYTCTSMILSSPASMFWSAYLDISAISKSLSSVLS